MKKTVMAVMMSLLILPAGAKAENSPLAAGTEDFLINCRHNRHESSTEMFGMQIALRQEISPLEDGRCRLVSVADSDFGVNTTTCVFGREELALLAEAYADQSGEEKTATIPFYTTDENGNSVAAGNMTLTGTGAEVLWGQFINNPDICTISFEEKNVAAEMAEAVRNCTDFNKKIDFLGAKAEISVALQADGCLYLLASEMPAVTTIAGEQKVQKPASGLTVRCLLDATERTQLAEFIERGDSYQYEIDAGDGRKSTFSLMLPQEFFNNPDICRTETFGYE